MFETDFFPLAQEAKHSDLLPESFDHLQENDAPTSLQDWGQVPGSRKLSEFKPDESRLKLFSALALGDDADEEAKGLVKAEGYQTPVTPDEEACLGLDVCVSLFGLNQAADPYLYWARQGKEAPQFKDMGEAHRAVWQDFSERTRVEDAAYKERTRRVQQEQEEISHRMVDCVAGKEGSWDACPADLLKYAESPQKAADSIMRARRAYAFAERRGFEDVWRSDALDMADLLTVNVNGNEVLDQQALMLLMTAIDRKVQESQTDSAAFWRNLYRSFADTARGAESLGVKAVQAVRGIPGMSGMEEWYSNNIAPLQGVKDTFDGQRQLFDRYEQRREALNTMQDVMHEFGQRMRGTSPDASWYVKAINGAGNITGQSLSYMAPGGWALALAGDMGHAGNAASRNGDSLVDVTINGLRNTVEEKGFGVFSVFGRMGAINKLMTRTGTGALARLAAKVPGRTFFAGTRTGKMLSTPAFAYVEEMAAEPLAGELFEWTARKLSGMTGMEVKPKDFEVVGPVLQAMGDVEQSGGCALFVAAMAAGHAPRMKQEVAAFVTDAQRAQLAGYTKKHAEEMASFSTAEHKAALAQKYFETDVLKDPEGAAERARKAGAELADRQEARLYQMSGALDKVLEKANIGRIRKLEGTDRYEVSLREGAVVNGVKMEEDRSVEMNEEQTDALVQVVLQGAYLNGVRVMQDAVLGNAAVSEAGKMDFIETLDMLSEEAPAEYRKAAAETGGMTVPGLMDVAARAQARIDAIVREEGVSVQEARSRTDAEVMGKVQLGSIADLAAAFERRLDHAVRSGEITRGRADEIKSGTAAASFAHRFTMAADLGSSLLLYAGGHATTANVMEDVQESALVHYMNLTGKDWQDLWEHLQAADAVLGRYGVSLGTYEGPAHDVRDVVESFSNLSLSSSLADIESLPVPQWVKDTAEFALKNLEDSARIIRMGEQWNEFAATDEGKKFMEEHGGLADALQAVGVSTESVFRQARMDAAQKLDVEMVHADLASRRAPGDATMTLGELEALEESMARMDAAEDVEETAEEEDETDPVTGIAGNPASPAPLVEDAGGSLEGVGEDAEHDEDAGAEFRDHAFVRVAPDCVFAQVRVDSLALAPDVEQFKQGDHNEHGAVKGRELQGRFREDAQPISVWRRRDGALHVITGRHRFDLAVRDGVEFIPAYVYQEDDAHDATWAKMHDVGQNMLDGQASALEVAFFVRNSGMARDEMEAQGYLRPGSANVMGWDIATLAGDEVFTRLKNGVITDNEAWKVCRLSSTEAGQMLAMQLREKGKPWDYVAAYVKEADRVAAEKSREGEAFDLFGNDTSWQEDCEKVARFAARGIALIAERLSLLKKSRGISRRKDLAGRMGIRLETDADLNAAIYDLERAKGAWQSHDPALRLHDRALAWDGTSEVNPFERVPVSGATFSVVAMDSSGTVLAPETFVTRKDGSPDWFVIPRRKGQPAMPVRLLVGSDIGEHRGYGLTHILASRGFSFWKDRSPERYISSILANVSELYEVAPGRELLVKGRQPSSWMLLQLDRKDGFYSIVSAYPVRQGKKPLGKKLPLAERQPANANSGTARLGPGSASKAALPSQSAGGGDGFSLPQGAHVVNVNEVECRFDDGAIVPATFSLSPEKETIRKKAVADGTFMKAPNGKDTNLTEDQWLSVRTEAFKNWFGDWEHDPEHASKVVDENGEPKVVYHGTLNVNPDYTPFTVFDSKLAGAGERANFFSDMRDVAGAYGHHVYHVFLNIRSPMIIDAGGDSWGNVRNRADGIKFGEMTAAQKRKFAKSLGLTVAEVEENFTPDEVVSLSKGRDTNEWTEIARKKGYDGVIFRDIQDNINGFSGIRSTSYATFNSVAIKSATDNRGTFDGENPDITFSIDTKKLDREYLDAVENGDMEKAQRMVNEFARAKGYVVDDSWKMDHRAPSKSGDTPQERQKNGEVSLLDMADGFGIIPEEMILDSSRNLELGWDNAHMNALSAVRRAMEQRRSLVEKGKNNKIPAIAMYRAVPRDIKEGDFRGGDWVTPSMEYAREHGESNLDGKYRIISHRVSIKDVYWNGDDICEWGYDDGVNYAYRNTNNNRKLLDPVTYDLVEVRDENGEYEGHDLGEWDSEKKKFSLIPYRFNYEERVIPLSKRFNFKNPDVSFSVIGPNAATWGKYADKAFAGRDDGKLRAEIDASQAQLKTAPGMPYLSRLDLLAEDIRYLKNPRKEGVLSDYLDYSELYDAYPRLKKMPVYVFKDRNRQEAGWYDSQDDSIAINLSSLGPLWNQRSTLLHEIQHAIQEYEGFAEGGDSGFAERVLTYQRNRITGDIIAKTRRRSWLLARDAALDALGRIRRLIRNPKAIKKMSERFAVHEVMDVDVMARQAIELLLKEYNKLVAQDAEYGKLTMGKDAEGCELPLCYAGMLLRGRVNVDAVTIEQIDRQIEMVKATVSRKMRFPGEEKRIWKELEKLYRGKEAVVRQLKDLEPFDLYQRLAGEIEARNVEKRRDMTAREREAVPFNDTLEFPGEAIVSFSIASAQEQGLFKSGHFEAGNAVITEPGVTFSIAALHASPHSFRKFDTAFMGKGEGAQAYGWGLYFAESPEVNRSYMNQFAQDKATWKFRDLETAAIEEMQRALVDSFLPKDALPEAKEDASDIAWSVLGDLVDAAKGSMTVSDVVMELHDEIDTNRKYAETYPQEREKMVQLEGFLLSLLDHLDEIEARPGMPSNYRAELNVDDYFDFMESGDLLFWDKGYGSSTTSRIGDWLLDEGKDEAYSLFNDKDPENGYWMGGKIYRSLADVLGSPREASEFLLRHGVKGIRYADGYTRGKAEEKQTYNYVIFDGNDIKITAYADESTGGAWADYVDPTASFSLATRESVWVTLEREAQKNRLEVLRSQTAKALETWRRVCAANDVKQGDGAEAFGRVMAVVASIYKTLPEGYRFGLYPYMRAAENLATRLEDGQAWLSDELKKETLMDDTSERMDAVIDKLLARTLEQADRYAVDQMRAEMVARIKAVQPTKKASGKFNKGKLSAEDYRHLHGIVAMMNTDQEAKEKRMLELEGVLSSNQSTEEERDAAELELKDWHTFGYLSGMGLEQTRACARALALFITMGRTAWSARLDEERRRTKFKAEKIVEGLGQATPQGGRDSEEDAKASTRTKAVKYLKYGLQSYSQLLNGWKKIPALRGLAHAEVTAIAEANVALRNMKHARDREVTALVKRCFGVQRTKDVARVLSDFKKTGDSGVVLNPLVKVERTVRIAEAREWVGLSFEEREERRKAIRKEYNDRGLSDDKASVPEALIPEMRRQLAELDELVKAGDGRAGRRKNITAKAEVVRPGRKGETLKVSRAQAMYAILLYEQAEYVETMRNEGIGEAEVARLREFVGAEGLAFGYGLRELMNRQGKLLARVYEEREGVPFPAVENYFRAVFRADHKLDTKASFGEQTNAVAGGAKYGMLIPRRKHNLHLAWNMDCEAVFQAASAEVENYICTADITARWRGILADKEAAASLKEHMGRHGIDSLRHWLDVIDGAGVMEGGALLAGAQATSRFQSAKAVALLAWNVLTMLKQTSGLMHGMFAGEVGMGSFLLHLGQTMSMTGRMGVFEMMKTEAFRARINDAQAELVSQLMGYASDQNYTGAIRFSMAGMRAIEKMDVWSNAVSMAALYNAKWSELEEAGKRTGAPMTEDEMHALCMQSVTRALELVAQPLTQSQKSMLGASTGLFAKMACFMSSEVLNKVGMIVSHVSSGNWGQALALYGMMSVAEQTVIALWHALLDDEDEWEKNGGWFGAMLGAPVAMIGGVPMLGAAVEFGYKQATGQRIYAGTASGVIDYSAIYRAAKNTWKAATGEKEMTFADWAELILLDAKAAAYVAGAGAGSRSKAADSVASWLLSVAGVANLSKPGFKLAE